MKKKMIFCLILVLILVGCHRAKPQQAAVVSQIVATANGQPSKIYTDPGKMGQILNTLRTLGQKTTAAIDPDTLPGDSWCITLERSDGTTQTYRTKGIRYFRQGQKSWQEIDPEKLAELDQLLRSLPSDI